MLKLPIEITKPICYNKTTKKKTRSNTKGKNLGSGSFLKIIFHFKKGREVMRTTKYCTHTGEILRPLSVRKFLKFPLR